MYDPIHDEPEEGSEPSSAYVDQDVDSRRKPTKFFQYIQEFLCRHGMSVAKFCSLAGIDEKTFANWKASRHRPSLSTGLRVELFMRAYEEKNYVPDLFSDTPEQKKECCSPKPAITKASHPALTFEETCRIIAAIMSSGLFANNSERAIIVKKIFPHLYE